MTDSTQIDINNLAGLIKLNINSNDGQQLMQQLEHTIKFIDQVSNAHLDTNNSDNQAAQASQYLRDDQVTEKAAIENMEQLAPNLQAGLFLVPQIID
jgi:aspartyl-tRNA(Asn)/glutamyl-tRNA(Gln) amidotransferase subunit C